jgi:hypothetical protein
VEKAWQITLAEQLTDVGRTGKLAFRAEQAAATTRVSGAGSSASQGGRASKRWEEVGERSISAKRAKNTRDHLVNVDAIPATRLSLPDPSLSLRWFPLLAHLPPPQRPSPPLPEGQGDDANALLQLCSLLAASPQVPPALSLSPPPRPSPPLPEGRRDDVNSLLHLLSLCSQAPQVPPSPGQVLPPPVLPPSSSPAAPLCEAQGEDALPPLSLRESMPVVEVSISGFSPSFSRDPSPTPPRVSP